jgi:hypothetical protein
MPGCGPRPPTGHSTLRAHSHRVGNGVALRSDQPGRKGTDRMFRRRKDHNGNPGTPAPAYAGRPGQEESMRVLAAFLAAPMPGAGGPAVPGGGPAVPGGAGTPGPPPPLAVTGWEGASPPPPPALNIRPLIGAETSYQNLPRTGHAMPLPIPGMGSVSTDRFQQVFNEVNELVKRLSGGADLSQRWVPDQVHTALAGLEVEHSQAHLTEEQYQSLRAALESMLAP